MWEKLGLLALLAVVSYVQNMAFTAVSRSRNSGDPGYHFRCAIISNGVWFTCHILVWNQIWTSVRTGDWLWLAATGIVYVLATALGSVRMMRILLKRETGARRVGARGDEKWAPGSCGKENTSTGCSERAPTPILRIGRGRRRAV